MLTTEQKKIRSSGLPIRQTSAPAPAPAPAVAPTPAPATPTGVPGSQLTLSFTPGGWEPGKIRGEEAYIKTEGDFGIAGVWNSVGPGLQPVIVKQGKPAKLSFDHSEIVAIHPATLSIHNAADAYKVSEALGIIYRWGMSMLPEAKLRVEMVNALPSFKSVIEYVEYLGWSQLYENGDEWAAYKKIEDPDSSTGDDLRVIVEVKKGLTTLHGLPFGWLSYVVVVDKDLSAFGHCGNPAIKGKDAFGTIMLGKPYDFLGIWDGLLAAENNAMAYSATGTLPKDWIEDTMPGPGFESYSKLVAVGKHQIDVMHEAPGKGGPPKVVVEYGVFTANTTADIGRDFPGNAHMLLQDAGSWFKRWPGCNNILIFLEAAERAYNLFLHFGVTGGVGVTMPWAPGSDVPFRIDPQPNLYRIFLDVTYPLNENNSIPDGFGYTAEQHAVVDNLFGEDEGQVHIENRYTDPQMDEPNSLLGYVRDYSRKIGQFTVNIRHDIDNVLDVQIINSSGVPMTTAQVSDMFGGNPFSPYIAVSRGDVVKFITDTMDLADNAVGKLKARAGAQASCGDPNELLDTMNEVSIAIIDLSEATSAVGTMMAIGSSYYGTPELEAAANKANTAKVRISKLLRKFIQTLCGLKVVTDEQLSRSSEQEHEMLVGGSEDPLGLFGLDVREQIDKMMRMLHPLYRGRELPDYTPEEVATMRKAKE